MPTRAIISTDPMGMDEGKGVMAVDQSQNLEQLSEAVRMIASARTVKAWGSFVQRVTAIAWDQGHKAAVEATPNPYRNQDWRLWTDA